MVAYDPLASGSNGSTNVFSRDSLGQYSLIDTIQGSQANINDRASDGPSRIIQASGGELRAYEFNGDWDLLPNSIPGVDENTVRSQTVGEIGQVVSDDSIGGTWVARYDCGGLLEEHSFGSFASDEIIPNSLGEVARIDITGSFLASDNDVSIRVNSLPNDQPAQLLCGSVFNSRPAPIGMAHLYVFGPPGVGLGRGPVGFIANNEFVESQDLLNIPLIGIVTAGMPVYWQLQYRDQLNGVTVFLLSEAAGLIFQ